MDEHQSRVERMWQGLFRPVSSPDSIHGNLDSIVTNPDLLRAANVEGEDLAAVLAQQAQQMLMERYHGAVYRYLRAAVRDPHVAEDLTQEFALRFIQGRFRHYTPEQGRFRDYLKGSLFNLVADYRRRSGRTTAGRLTEDLAAEESSSDTFLEDRLFVQSWRKELLTRAWAALARQEEEGTQPYYTVLRYRSEHPDQSSQQIADALGPRLGKVLTAASVRKTLERARDSFRQFLIEDLKHSLGDRQDALQEELIDLDLLKYCKEDL